MRAILFLAAGIIAMQPVGAVAGEREFNQCVLDNLKGSGSDTAAKLIMISCRNLHPKSPPSPPDEKALAREREISAAAKAQAAMLNRQLAELRVQIAALNESQEASEVKDMEQQAQIFNLGTRLNAALAKLVDCESKKQAQ